MAESEEELKNLVMKVKVESEKVGLKLNIQKIRIMASGPITSWQTDGETMETVTDFIFLGSKITADGDCSLEIESHLLLGLKITLLMKAQHEGALTPPGIVRRNPQVPHTAREVTCHPVNNWRGKQSSIPPHMKAQHKGALPPPCIVRRNPRVPHTAR